MGVFYDLGRPVVGGWMGGGWLLHDPVRKLDLLWGGEFGQEGAILFAIDVDSGRTVEEFRVGRREFSATPDPQTDTLWICTYHGLYQLGAPATLVESTRPKPSHTAFPRWSTSDFVVRPCSCARRHHLLGHPSPWTPRSV